MKMKRLPEKKKQKGITQTRNKEKTKRLILDAASELISSEGLQKVAINKIAARAGRSKKMIYDYYGSLEGLVEELLRETDHWLSYTGQIAETINVYKSDNGKEFASLALKKHFQQMYSSPLLQEMALMAINHNYKFVSEVTKQREEIADAFFPYAEEYFQGTDINIRSIYALLLGGINYIILHSKGNNPAFCGISITDLEHQAKLKKSVEQIVSWAFDAAKKR